MPELTIISSDTQTSHVRLGPSFGYRLDGDNAALNAEIEVASTGTNDAELALQLWACAEPYHGGPLSGYKVSESLVHVAKGGAQASLDALGFARTPAEARDFAMVLVLESRVGGASRVLDYANFPLRQRFVLPHFVGRASYAVQDGRVHLQLPGVLNPRAEDNLSGSLEAQLWALSAPYADGAALNGTLLSAVQLGCLAGQHQTEASARETALNLPAARAQHVVLVLCEWTAQGQMVRDYQNFAEAYAGPLRDEPVAAAVQPSSPPRLTLITSPGRAPEPKSAPPAIAAGDAGANVRPSLNRVTEAELAKLTGLPKKLLADLVRARPFKSFDDIRRVRGIGDKTVQKLRQSFTL
jgi:hypothetical protein